MRGLVRPKRRPWLALPTLLLAMVGSDLPAAEGDVRSQTNAVVLHAIGGPDTSCPTGQLTFSPVGDAPSSYEGTTAEFWADYLRGTVASIHYVVDRQGNVARYIDEDKVANHVLRTYSADGTSHHYNDTSIGIELVNAGDGVEAYPEVQVEALTRLLAGILGRWCLRPSDILTHAELDLGPGGVQRTFQCGGEAVARKQDPGPRLPLAQIRARLAESLALASSPTAAIYEVVALPEWSNCPGLLGRDAAALSGDGRVFAGDLEGHSWTEPTEAIRWSGARCLQRLGGLHAGIFNSGAYGASADGSVVVGTANYGVGGFDGYRAFKWSETDGMQPLPAPPQWTAAGGRSEGQAVSADGKVVVGSSDIATGETYLSEEFVLDPVEGYRWEVVRRPVYYNRAYRWSTRPGEGDGDLGSLHPTAGYYAANSSRATGVSADGNVVVGTDVFYGDPDAEVFTEEIQAFRWTVDGGLEGLGDLPGGPFQSQAYDVSADGKVVVGQGYREHGWCSEAFRWTRAEGMQGLGHVDGAGARSVAYGTSGDGSVVVGYNATCESGFSDPRAFYWAEGKPMRLLASVLEQDHRMRLDGWTLFYATAVSDDGSVVAGCGQTPEGRDIYWLADLARGPVTDRGAVEVMELLMPTLMRLNQGR
ncbi:MAG: N-acetylmuramoyl-L-alanine amidase [Chromatiales bacterium]|nr:N-acetylmuramoyl-L-alanine amidase [Chromatiales bacterium]